MKHITITRRAVLRGVTTGIAGVAVGGVVGRVVGCTLIPPQPTTPPIECTSGQHVWNGYHLPHDGMSPVIDNRSSFVVPIEKWNAYETPVTLRAAGIGFTITVEDGGDADSGWLGLASVRVNAAGHIISGKVTMNQVLLSRYPAAVWAHVMWQELGHLAGLDHQRGVDDSSMEDCVGRRDWLACISNPEAIGFNQHDLDQLSAIYSHVTGDDPPAGCSSADGAEVIVHAFPTEGAHG